MSDEPLLEPDQEPDPRFTLANERTYLAWIRTALALIAAGVALASLRSGMSESMHRSLAGSLIGIGTLCAVAAHRRWGAVQVALRRQRPLPTLGLSATLGYGIGLIGIVLILWV